MTNRKATIYDYRRLCRTNKCDSTCPLDGKVFDPRSPFADIDELNDIILDWCDKHPVRARQNEFLKLYPNAMLDDNGVLCVPPCRCDSSFKDYQGICTRPYKYCSDCRKDYWTWSLPDE